MDEICRRLKQARKAKGLTQQQVADHLNIHRTTYTKIETGQTELSIFSFGRLADLLEVDALWLLGKTPEKEPLESTRPQLMKTLPDASKDLTLFGEIEKCFPEMKKKVAPGVLKAFAASSYDHLILYSLRFTYVIRYCVLNAHPHIRIIAKKHGVDDIYLLVTRLFYVYINR